MSVIAQVPTIGRIVLYKLTTSDADAINRRRNHAAAHLAEHRDAATGVQIHVGNGMAAGDIFPMVITRVWGTTPESCVNGQVMLDGNDLLWVTSSIVGTEPGQFAWPVRT